MKKPQCTIECIIFDFGNVVAFFDHRKAGRQLAALSSRKLSDIQINKIHKEIFEGNVEEKYDTGRTTTDDFIADLRSRLKIPASVPDSGVGAAWSDIFSPNQPVIDLIPRLRAMGFRLVLASNTNELHHAFFKEQFREVLEYFHETVTSYETGLWKPDKGFYVECLKRTGTEAENCVFVDDKENNIKGATRSGMTGIRFVSADTLVMRLGEMGIPLIFPKGEDAQTRAENDRWTYREKYSNWKHFDTLRWQVPGVVFATSALLFSVARGQNNYPPWWLLILYGAFVYLCSFLMGRIDFNMARNNMTLRGVAAGIGDNSLPPKPLWRESAANLVRWFLVVLSIVAVMAGIGLAIWG